MVEEENISEPIKAGNKADSEAVEKLVSSSKEAKDLAESLLKEGYATNVVVAKTGLSAEVVCGLKGSLVKKNKKFKEEVAKAKKLEEKKKGEERKETEEKPSRKNQGNEQGTSKEPSKKPSKGIQP